MFTHILIAFCVCFIFCCTIGVASCWQWQCFEFKQKATFEQQTSDSQWRGMWQWT